MWWLKALFLVHLSRPCLWLAETFSASPLKPLNGILWNLTGSKISKSSTKFVFFGLISKQKCLPWPIPQKGGTLYSGARYVALWASCFHISQKRFSLSYKWSNCHKNWNCRFRELLVPIMLREVHSNLEKNNCQMVHECWWLFFARKR